MINGFAFVDEAVPHLRWDAKYATWDNFTGRPVDGYEINRIVASAQLCTALARARDRAVSAGYGLLLWDGYRPQRATEAFWHWAQQPDDDAVRAQFHPHCTRSDIFDRGYIDRHSGHSRGSAIDLTLYHLDTLAQVPMGGRHDLMDTISHHGASELPREVQRARQDLRILMLHSGFDAYEQEWWHYSLRNEPFPDTYFDFPIADA